jgi:hypothetical protein
MLKEIVISTASNFKDRCYAKNSTPARAYDRILKVSRTIG